jgi:hypothetical protein
MPHKAWQCTEQLKSQYNQVIAIEGHTQEAGSHERSPPMFMPTLMIDQV